MAEEPYRPQPYFPDAHTLHLWHLDEDGPPFGDAASTPTPLLGLLNGARAGQGSLPGFGRSVSFHHVEGDDPESDHIQGAILLAASQLDYGPRDNVNPPFPLTGQDGAFTFEALVRLDIPPSETRGTALGIISMDGDDRDPRVFNFRIEKSGFLAFIPMNRIGSVGSGLAAIPTSGLHAIDTSSWFHVAVSYNGRDAEPGNCSFYWTRLQPGLSRANRIGRFTLAADLPNELADFAIGNEARSATGGGREADPFPGLIDEVRISSVARHPSDFHFVPPAYRLPPNPPEPDPAGMSNSHFGLAVNRIHIDGRPVPAPTGNQAIEIGPGLHYLEIDLQLHPEERVDYSVIRSQLSGLDESWQTGMRGMEMVVECLDEAGLVVNAMSFPAYGLSKKWRTSFVDTELDSRYEAVFIPAGTTQLRIRLSSGSPDTTGMLMIDDLDACFPGSSGEVESIWFNNAFSEGEVLDSAAGTPKGWQRGGTNLSMARIPIETRNPALALVDVEKDQHAEWIATAPIRPSQNSRTLLLSWKEAYNVLPGRLYRASFAKVPAGKYTFRAVASSEAGDDTTSLEIPIRILPPLWERNWFQGLLSILAGIVAILIVVAALRRRHRHRLRELERRQILSEDRARIARDMHDDLGTRVTLMTLNAALIERDIDNDPEQTRQHLSSLKSSARNLVAAMDDLVWSVDPRNDRLDRLGNFIARSAEELFRDTPVRWRIDLPETLPDLPLRAPVRHHFSLAVKEALHNILRHAGPCEARIRIRVDDERIDVVITDTGSGFVEANSIAGNGLANLRKRMLECGGVCEVESTPGKGTSVRLIIPLSSSLSRNV